MASKIYYCCCFLLYKKNVKIVRSHTYFRLYVSYMCYIGKYYLFNFSCVFFPRNIAIVSVCPMTISNYCDWSKQCQEMSQKTGQNQFVNKKNYLLSSRRCQIEYEIFIALECHLFLIFKIQN